MIACKYLPRNFGSVLWYSNFFISSHNQVFAVENLEQQMKIFFSSGQIRVVLNIA